jgi:hypothetical protein
MPRRDDDFEDDRPRREDDDYDRDDRSPPRKKKGIGLVGILAIVGVIVVLCGGCLIGGLFYGVGSVRDAANRMKSSNNLKQTGLALHNYNDAQGELPSNTYTPDGKPLLSWRVHLLPYIEQDILYKQFKLDEAWDSPNNIRLVNQMPQVYALPNAPPVGGKTHYRGFSSPGAVFDRRLVVNERRQPKDMFTLAGFKDGISNTILVVEAADPVEWTKPDDLDASPGTPFPRMGTFQKGKKFQALMGDGQVRLLPADMSETTLRALVTHSGGEQLPAGWDQ